MNRRARARAGEWGSGTLLVAGCLLLACVVAGIALVLGGYVVAQHAAADAADLIALSGAAGHARGVDACATARTVARANEVTLTSCSFAGDDFDFVVRVAVVKKLSPPAGLPDTVAASAEAGRLSGG